MNMLSILRAINPTYVIYYINKSPKPKRSGLSI